MDDEIKAIKRKIKEFYEDSMITYGSSAPQVENYDSEGTHRELISKSLAKLAKKMARKEYAIARKALKDQL
jgi:hypothetical protein